MAIGANERRIIELVLKATGAADLKRMQTDLTQMRQSAQESQKALASLQSGFATLGKAAAAIGLATIITSGFHSFIAAATEAIDVMDELSVTITKVGVAAGDLQKLQYAANLSNVGLDALNTGLTKLSKNIVDLQNKSGPATAQLRSLGITAGSSVFEAMQKLADQFAKMPDGAQKTALAIQQFGKSGAELIPILNLGSDGLAQLGEEAEKAGLIMSGEALAAANAFNDELDRISAMATAATQQLVAGLLPALTALAQEFLAASNSGTDFYSVGGAIGGMIISLTKDIVGNVATLRAYTQSVIQFATALELAAKAVGEALRGDFGASDATMASAKQAFDTSLTLWRNAEAIGNQAAQRIENRYQQALYTAKIEGAKLDRTGAGGDTAADAAGAARAGNAARAKAAADEKKQVDELAKALGTLRDQLAKSNEERENATAAIREQALELERAANPQIAYIEGLARLDELNRTVGLSTAAYAAELARLNEERQRANQEIVANSDAEKARREEQEKNNKELEKVREQWGFVADAAAQATYDVIAGTEKIGQAVKKMVATIISELVRMALIKGALKIFGLGGPLDVGFTASAQGNAFGSTGVISVPTAHATAGGGAGVMGEAGPEAIMPLQRNAQGQLGIAAPANLGVTVNNYAGAEIGVRQSNQGLEIDVVRRQLADDVRRGGSALSAALEQTYRVGRQASAT